MDYSGVVIEHLCYCVGITQVDEVNFYSVSFDDSAQ